MKNYVNDIESYFLKLKNTIDFIDRNEINGFIKLLVKARNAKKNIFIMGNGGSAATASHFCCDFNKGLSHNSENRFRFFCLNDNIPTITAYSNDVSYDDIFIEQLKNFFESGDYVIGISGSGNSRNIIKAIDFANKNNGITIGLSGFNGGILKKIAKYSVHANIDDMQISEDLHMILCHLIMKTLNH